MIQGNHINVNGNNLIQNGDMRHELSDEASEVLSSAPSWLMRWGTLSIIAILCLFLVLSVLIKYPDSLEGNVIVTTNPLPIVIKTNTTGRIASLFVKDGTGIDKGEPIAEIENPVGYQNILRLDACCKKVSNYLKHKTYDSLFTILAMPIIESGDAQAYYNQLLQNISSFLLLSNEEIYNKRIFNLRNQIHLNEDLLKISENENLLMEDELRQANEKFTDNTQLFHEKIIAKHEFFDKASTFRQKQLLERQQQKAQLQSKSTIEDYRKQILEITFDKHESERVLITAMEGAIRNIQNYIRQWEQQYLLMSPNTGKLFYLHPLQLNENIITNDPIFMMVPQKYNYLAIAELPANGIGKIKEGMTAHLLLDNYPYNEYGYIEAKVDRISYIPITPLNTTQEKNIYRIHINVADSLNTTHHITIPFTPNIIPHCS